MPSTYYVAWWNLENLFDEKNRRMETARRRAAQGFGRPPARSVSLDGIQYIGRTTDVPMPATPAIRMLSGVAVGSSFHRSSQS